MSFCTVRCSEHTHGLAFLRVRDPCFRPIQNYLLSQDNEDGLNIYAVLASTGT